MNVIFHVLDNLKHNGDTFSKGTFFEGELAMFEHLVKDGVLRVVEGAKSVAEAADIVAKEAEAVVAAAEVVEAPKDTWGPKKEDPENPDTVQNQPQAPEATAQPATPGQVGPGDVPPADLPSGDDL